jgi:hypothetical protein
LLEGEALDGEAARAKVRSVVDEVRRQARAERMARFQKMREESDREWVTEVSAKANFSEDQAAGVERVLADQREAQQRLWQSVRDGDKTLSEARTERQATRGVVEQRLGELLDAGQLETVRESLRQRRGPGGRGGWR